jgi:lipoate---protein ligase
VFSQGFTRESTDGSLNSTGQKLKQKFNLLRRRAANQFLVVHGRLGEASHLRLAQKLVCACGSMKYLDLTFATPAANLACDEALLDACDEQPSEEILRFWEPVRHFVVLGYANRAAAEADLDACRARQIPVHRRCSGGGTVLQGPGCLNYSLVLRLDRHSELETIPAANRYIMERQRQSLEGLMKSPISIQGITDLSFFAGKDANTGGLVKFSGNAQRRKRHALLFHGTFLLDFDIDLIQQILPMPSREPEYRQHRPHRQFLDNLRVSAAAIKAALRETWAAVEEEDRAPEIPSSLLQKYGSEEWNFKF